MTCIVALKDSDGKIWMGADSAGINGWALTLRSDPKIYRVKAPIGSGDDFEMLIGFTSSFRMGQLLGYKLYANLTLPGAHDDVMQWMSTVFVDAVRKTLKDGGYTKIEHNEERGGQCLVAFRGRIFLIDNDFQIGESILPYDAIGCGHELAQGAMATMSKMIQVWNMGSYLKIRTALEVAEAHCAGVRGPFRVEELRFDGTAR